MPWQAISGATPSRGWSVFASGYDVTSKLEVLLGEGSPGMGLQVCLELDGLDLVSESNSGFDSPRKELRRVLNSCSLCSFPAINASFFARDHFLIWISRRRAWSMVSKGSE